MQEMKLAAGRVADAPSTEVPVSEAACLLLVAPRTHCCRFILGVA